MTCLSTTVLCRHVDVPVWPAGSGGSDLASGATTSASRLAAVRLVTAGDVAAGRYAVTDVVLPLPGTQVRYPTHETGQRMRQVRPGAGRLGLLRRYVTAHACIVTAQARSFV